MPWPAHERTTQSQYDRPRCVTRYSCIILLGRRRRARRGSSFLFLSETSGRSRRRLRPCPRGASSGLGHWLIGGVDWHILGFLLLGSLPGIFVGSHLAAQIA